MFSDISDGVRLAAEKTQLETQYRQLLKTESLGRMAGAIAHHFNNLLGVVMGNLELAMDGLPEGTGPHHNVTSAIQAAQRAAEISSSMLIYLGQALAKHEPMDLASTCRSSLAKVREVLPDNVDMVVDIPMNGPIINANEYQIEQTLKNLITNAWESMHHHRGTIHLSIKTFNPMEIPATYRFPLDWQAEADFYACLTVMDTGCGINVSDLEKLFDPFYTSRFLGRGLGLSIVLGVVRSHKGVVTVISKVGRGSTFNVFLPI
jgi:signal transduction histidine kinase